MAALAERLGLEPDEFAFHFDTKVGIDADALAIFLQRAATVARRSGAELRVVGLREGSLDVIIKTFKKGTSKAFAKDPLDASIKTATLATAVVGTIIAAMTYIHSGPAPIAKSGATMVVNHNVTRIVVVTKDDSTVVMDKKIAAAVREAEEEQKLLNGPDAVPRLSAPVAGMLREARSGNLSGETSLVKGELHFRPDGYRYWVPVDEFPVSRDNSLEPDMRYRVSGNIVTAGGQPDRIVIERADRIPN